MHLHVGLEKVAKPCPGKGGARSNIIELTFGTISSIVAMYIATKRNHGPNVSTEGRELQTIDKGMRCWPWYE